MVSKKSRSEVRLNKHRKLRNRFSGTAERPRLAVFRSNNHMYAQIIDDTVGNTLVAASTVEKAVSAELENYHIDRLKNGTCTAQVGSVYLQTVSHLERIGDHITNISASIKQYC